MLVLGDRSSPCERVKASFGLNILFFGWGGGQSRGRTAVSLLSCDSIFAREEAGRRMRTLSIGPVAVGQRAARSY